jgi:Spx/MgsR family transcriptional regulator
MIILYGIPNCDTMKKARRWLDEQAIEYRFHNYKKDGIDLATLESWEAELGWETLLNKRGSTWRKLPDETKDAIGRDSALQVMMENPSIIKRPVLDLDGRRHVGFNVDVYQSLFD